MRESRIRIVVSEKPTSLLAIWLSAKAREENTLEEETPLFANSSFKLPSSKNSKRLSLLG